MAADQYGLQVALFRIRNLPEFEHYRKYLESELKVALDTLINSTDEAVMRQAQGAAKQIRRLMDSIEKAPATLEKIRG